MYKIFMYLIFIYVIFMAHKPTFTMGLLQGPANVLHFADDDDNLMFCIVFTL